MIVFDIDLTEREPYLEVVVELGGREYTLVARWLDRRESWYLDLFDADDQPILRGQRLSINNLVAQDLQGDQFPAGRLMLVDAGSNAECDFDALGSRCVLHYFEPEEVVFPRDINRTDIPYVIEEVP